MRRLGSAVRALALWALPAIILCATASAAASAAYPATVSAAYPAAAAASYPAADRPPPGGAAAPAAGPGRPSGDRAWPVGGARGARPLVVRGWDPPPEPWKAGHRGVDLAAGPGQPVRAAAPGTITFAGPVAGRPVLVVELSGTGDPPLRTTYEPVRATARVGDRVAAGEVIGVLAGGPLFTHCRNGVGGVPAPAGCLHWGLRRGEAYLDPLSLLPPHMLRRAPSRLLPLTGAFPLLPP
ncbi:murein hydrolase activator EnvC family protein [Streptomyces syringium]|uniref:murein hydrolase activator EnvC family protein n=1 Tax=Streptomyces syringium TaxID=76729 RepID=UPI003AAE126E